MGRPIPSKAIQHGYHYDQAAYRDNMQVRCSRCGFICNLDRDLRSHPGGYESWGYNFTDDSVYSTYGPVNSGTVQAQNFGTGTYTDTSGNTTYTNVVNSITDPVISAGCSQCGTLLYNNPAHGTRG